MAKNLRIAGAILLALTIILSCTLVVNKLTDPATYAHTIEVLDHNRTTILGLTAASAAASAAVSALPDDVCSPLSQEISDFTTYFMLILSVIYLEKYLLTILAAAACYLLIPAGCSSLLVNCFFPSGVLKSIGTKLIDVATNFAKQNNYKLLQVKTLDESFVPYDKFYEITRKFYNKVGFYNLECLNIWGNNNPCIIRVKPIN